MGIKVHSVKWSASSWCPATCEARAARVVAALEEWYGASPEPLVVLHGHCPLGVDAMVHRWCLRRHVDVRAFPADWARYGKSAGPRRNAEMAQERPDIVLIFCDRHSRGTEHMLSLVQGRAPWVEVQRQ